ncbi:hypothetical protein Pmani_033756 [Petrolisthes manimaculis]|uniref:Uncharacterized protein n=1 Tax=Petrolisthes manimaculis TaxID=1843537 RepID=A0AAE1NQQ9_9EUCA|nr:hypothetical protein Pmani_033756 [Petrolisthes manimaculis]
MREAIDKIDIQIQASMQMKNMNDTPSQMQQNSLLRHHQKVVQRCCLALTHHTAPINSAIKNFGIVLTPFLLTSPEEFGRKTSMSQRTRSNTLSNDPNINNTNIPAVPRVIVIFEVDPKAEVVKVMRRIIPYLTHPDIHLILFHPSWSTFKYFQLGKQINADKLFYECQALTTSNKAWKFFKRFIKSVLLSSLEFTSSLMEEHTGKIVLIKTMNEAIPNDALYWIKENCSRFVLDVYGCCNLSGNDLLPEEMQERLICTGGNFLPTTPLSIGYILSHALFVKNKELFDVSVHFTCSSKFVITGVYGYGVRDIISNNGYLMTFKMGRIHQGQQISLTLEPRKEEFIQAG